MKVRFLKNIVVDVEKASNVWNKPFNKWDEIIIESIYPNGKYATMKTYDGEYLLMIPTDSFQRIIEKKHLPCS